MPERVIIENGLARVETYNVTDEISAHHLLPQLERRGILSLPIAPKTLATIAYDGDTRNGVCVTRREPLRHTIKLDDEQYSLQFPWLYFVWKFTTGTQNATDEIGEDTLGFTINGSQVFWRPTEAHLPTDGLWTTHLPNTYDYGGICWGDTSAETDTLARRIDDLTLHFLDTEFNSDLDWSVPRKYDDLYAWQADSDDPFCYLDWPEWTQRHYLTLGEALTSIRTPTHNTAILDFPPPPDRFSYARAYEWALNAPHADRIRLLHGVRDAIEVVENSASTPAGAEA
jgi:hypothetical protein